MNVEANHVIGVFIVGIFNKLLRENPVGYPRRTAPASPPP